MRSAQKPMAELETAAFRTDRRTRMCQRSSHRTTHRTDRGLRAVAVGQEGRTMADDPEGNRQAAGTVPAE